MEVPSSAVEEVELKKMKAGASLRTSLGKMVGVDEGHLQDPAGPRMKVIAERVLMGDLHADSYRKKVKEMRTFIHPMKEMLRAHALEKEEQLFTESSEDHTEVASLTFDHDEVHAIATRIHGGLKQKQLLTATASSRSADTELLELVRTFGRFHVDNLVQCECCLGKQPVGHGPTGRHDLQAATTPMLHRCCN